MKLIKLNDIKKLNISVNEYYKWVVDIIKNKNLSILPPKISIKPYDGVFCNVMPCFIPNEETDYEGIKIVTRYPDRSPALDSKLLLLNGKTGEYLALMDADWITAMRTGAVAAHSIMLFAKSNYKIIGMIGLGNMARSVLYTLLELNPEREFIIKLFKFQKDEELFYERFKHYKNVKWLFFDTYEDIIRGSDVVISCVTYAPKDFCNDDVFDEGVLVVPVHTLGFTNCDLFFDKVYADDTGHVSNFKNFNKFKNFSEVSDVVNGIKKGRESDKERILAYNIGISLHDVNFAAHIYELLKKDKNISEINIEESKEKYWI